MPDRRHGSRLDRPALSRRLAGALERGALMLAGPAGGGKTTALELAAAARGGAIAWVSCERADADPGRLLARIVGAIQEAAPGAADPLAARLAAVTEPVRARAVARGLAAELAERLSAPLTVVLDDAEHLAAPGAAAPHRATAVDVVRLLAAADVALLRVAIAAESPLEIPAERIGIAELALTSDECVALLGPGGARVHAATGGWPLGVVLTARTGRALRPGDAVDEHLDALLAPLDEEQRAALVDAVAAPAIDAAVVRALQPPDGFLDALRASGVPLHERAGRLTLQPLVRDALARRLERERPSEYRELLHARLAQALDAAGRGAEAVEHWLEVPEEAAAAVARHGEAVIDTAPATVTRWLARVGVVARTAPELQVLEGRIALGDGRLEDAPGPLREAVVGFEARGDEASAWGARLALADALAGRERFEAAAALASGWERARAPAAPMVAVTAAAALAASGAFEEAVALFERATAVPGGAAFAPFAGALRAAWVDVPRGEFDAALARVRTAVAVLRRADPFGRLAHVLLSEAMVLEEREEHAAALATAARARGLGERAAPGGTVADLGRRLTAGVLARLGRAGDAEAELAALEGPGTGWYAGDEQVTRAMIASAQGDHARAAEEARRAVEAGALGVWRTRERALVRLVPVLAAAPLGSHGLDPARLIAEALAAAPPGASVARLQALRAGLR